MYTFIPPWAKDTGDAGRYPAVALERHTAICRALDVADSTSPLELRAELARTVDQERVDALAAGDKAVELYAKMIEWSPPEHDRDDTTSIVETLTKKSYSHAALFGGRGGGKSHGAVEAVVELASTGKERVVCVREFQNSTAESVKELFETKIKASRWVNQWKITDYELENMATGSRVTFIGISRNTTAIKSLEGATIVLCEEAADLSEKSIDILVPTVMRMASSRMIWVWNPVETTTPVDVMFRTGEPPERSIIRCIQSESNAWFYTGKMPGEQRASFNKHSGEKFRWIWRGGYLVQSELAVYNNWQIGRFDVPLGNEPRYGLDWGWTDPMAALELFIIEPGELGRDPEKQQGVIYIRNEVYGSKIPARQIPDKLDKTIPLMRGASITADSSEPKSIEDLNNEGFVVTGAVKGPGSIRAGISLIQGYDIWISPDCPYTAAEMNLYRWKTDKNGTILRDPVDANNHACDTIRYALEGYEPPSVGGVIYV